VRESKGRPSPTRASNNPRSSSRRAFMSVGMRYDKPIAVRIRRLSKLHSRVRHANSLRNGFTAIIVPLRSLGKWYRYGPGPDHTTHIPLAGGGHGPTFRDSRMKNKPKTMPHPESWLGPTTIDPKALWAQGSAQPLCRSTGRCQNTCLVCRARPARSPACSPIVDARMSRERF
jgi:hypothetical protein